MKIGTVEARQGTLSRGQLPLGEYPDGGAIASPLIVASGRKPGPVLWVQTCIHGNEVGGPVAVHRFLESLDLEALSGTIVFALQGNPLAFRELSRATPQDGQNLNRLFPGSAQGSLSEIIADRLIGTALETADAMLDLHSGGHFMITCHYALYHDDGSAAGRETARLVRGLGVPNLWNSLEEWLSGAAFAQFTKAGKPGLIVETGGGARVTEEDIERFVLAIEGMTRGLGMLPGAPVALDAYRYGTNAVDLTARRGGLYRSLVEAGDEVVRDQLVGEVIDIFGDVTEEVRCPLEHGWVGAIRRPWMPIYSGEEVIEIIETMPEPA
ncbi:succinylglutamate desuccinylase/aspartoacylase family protein [Aquibium sp. A9E412]|uniref:succinylglutamate desuccinylase/aspartoacylase family protein n=1 Tax=Aquibium sp. A9E412 TaxID=2976767 RepID=UPI0025AF98AE|nr:succinylglutamate desuccinylase/aspartoacylase family protein [Aquibium sp. A9E412]MDN2567307.1 succinylglutamate desuccinylase/aspartoacylase family protein [Aquibium sp. A9E412]